MRRTPYDASDCSSLCTATLASILELTRAHQAELAAAPSLVASIRTNLGSIRTGLEALQGAAQSDGDREMLEGLQRQHRRLVDLVQGLGYQVETPAASPAVPEDVMCASALSISLIEQHRRGRGRRRADDGTGGAVGASSAVRARGHAPDGRRGGCGAAGGG